MRYQQSIQLSLEYTREPSWAWRDEASLPVFQIPEGLRAAWELNFRCSIDHVPVAEISPALTAREVQPSQSRLA
jgi:hypothetical protein